MSAAVAVQTPPATVAVVVTVVLPSVKCTVTVWPSSTPEVVPTPRRCCPRPH
jgi:hypothetical protein